MRKTLTVIWFLAAIVNGILIFQPGLPIILRIARVMLMAGCAGLCWFNFEEVRNARKTKDLTTQ